MTTVEHGINKFNSTFCSLKVFLFGKKVWCKWYSMRKIVFRRLRMGARIPSTWPPTMLTNAWCRSQITYTFLLFLHSWWHLRNCPVNRWIIRKIREFLSHVYRHGLASIQGPRPKWKLGHICWQHKTLDKANIKTPKN